MLLKVLGNLSKSSLIYGDIVYILSLHTNSSGGNDGTANSNSFGVGNDN